MRLIRIFLIISLLMIGCAAPSYYKPVDLSRDIQFIDHVEPVKTERLSKFLIVDDDIDHMPETRVAIEFHESVAVSEFFYSLSQVYNINFIVQLSQKTRIASSPDSTETQLIQDEMKISVPKYSGTLKDLLRVLRQAHGLFFYRVGSSILIRDSATCHVRLLYQDDKDILTLVQKTFGARDVHIDRIASVVVFNADSSVYLRITDYFKHYPVSVVELDIAFLEFELSDDQASGIDVSKLSLALQSGLDLSAGLSIRSDNGFTVGIQGGSISLQAVIQSLSSYSKFHLIQRVGVSGLVGKQIILDVSEKIPYVAKVTTQAGQSGSALRGFEFASVSSGMTFSVDVNADKDAVILKNDLRYQSVPRFLEVGSDSERYSQPVVNARNLTSYITMRPGEVSKLASIRYTKISNNHSGLSGLSGMLRGSTSRQYEVVVLGRAILKRYIFQ